MAGRNGYIYTFYQLDRQNQLCRQLKKMGLKYQEIADLKWSQIHGPYLMIGKRKKKIPRELRIELLKVSGVRHLMPCFPDHLYSSRDFYMPYILYLVLPSFSIKTGVKYEVEDVMAACGKVPKSKIKNHERKPLTFIWRRAILRTSNEAH